MFLVYLLVVQSSLQHLTTLLVTRLLCSLPVLKFRALTKNHSRDWVTMSFKSFLIVLLKSFLIVRLIERFWANDSFVIVPSLIRIFVGVVSVLIFEEII